LGEEMRALGFLLNASWDLVNRKCATRFLAAALCDVYFLVVCTLPDGHLNIQFMRCSEPGTTFGVKDPVKEAVETFG
jgi:hypothetical protein